MNNKCFYVSDVTEFYNNYRIAHRRSNLRYKEMPKTHSVIIYRNYADLAKALAAKKIRSDDFFTMQSSPGTIHSKIWYDGKVVKVKDFDKYTQIITIVKYQPSYKDVMSKLPLEDLLDWYKDNDIIPNGTTFTADIVRDKLNKSKEANP